MRKSLVLFCIFAGVLQLLSLPGASAQQGVETPGAVQQVMQQSHGFVRVGVEGLDGSTIYQVGGGFIVDAAKGFVVSSTQLLPTARAAIEDVDAITFYKTHADASVTEIRAYVYALSLDYEIAILQLDAPLPAGVAAATFATAIPQHSPLYASAVDLPVAVQGQDMTHTLTEDGYGHVIRTGLAQPVDRSQQTLRLDTSVDLPGAMVVDAQGRVVGMGHRAQEGAAALTPASIIQDLLAEAYEAEQTIRARGGITPLETYTVKKLAGVFEQMMLLYATHALERPASLQECAYEMFAMRRSGACRDVFSSYLPPSQARQQAQLFTGQVGSVGLKMMMKEGQVVIVTPLYETPAARAGIKPGDILQTVDNRAVTNLADATTALHGVPGSAVTFTVRRHNDDGAPQALQFTVARERLALKTVDARVLQQDHHAPVGVIRINRFRANTVGQFQAAVNDLQAQGITNIIADVRHNPGGSLRAAVQMLALFMRPEDTLLVLRERAMQEQLDATTLQAEYGIHTMGVLRSLNMVIVVDGGSASAAEIFAGTLQDWGYTVVGKPSFGKGVAQAPVTLSDDSMLLLTTSEFLVGNNHVPIRDQGVTPQVIVANPSTAEDAQLTKAIAVLRAQDRTNVALK